MRVFVGFMGKMKIKNSKKLKKINNSFVQENCFVTMMHIIPGIIENDFKISFEE